MEFRFATMNDLERLSAWNYELVQDEGLPIVMGVPELRERMKIWLAGDHKAVLFGPESDPLAYALYRESPYEVYVIHLFVRRDRRGKGIGREAVGVLRDQVWSTGKRVSVEVPAASVRAATFWRSIGFKDHSATLEILPESNDVKQPDDTAGLFMSDDVRAFGMELGLRAIARDWPAVHEMLAPWLRARLSVDDVRAFFEDEYRATLAASGVGELRYPEYPEPELGGNGFTKATQLREPLSFAGGKVRPVPPEVTDENVRWWLSLQLTCSDAQMEELGFDYFCEVWIAVVETGEGLRVGYWSQGAY